MKEKLNKKEQHNLYTLFIAFVKKGLFFVAFYSHKI